MGRAGLLLFVMLVSGCASGADDISGPTSSPDGLDELLSPDRSDPSFSDRLFLRDPDALGVAMPGLRHLNITSNATFRITQVTLGGAQNTPRWLVVVPSSWLGNWTASCGPEPETLRVRSFHPAFDSITGYAFEAGNWSVIVWSETLTNLTLHFNTTTAAGFRYANGTSGGLHGRVLDADPRVESDSNPYRVSFNKTFRVENRSLVLGAFAVRGDAFFQFREIRTKVESADGFLCAEHRNQVANPATGGAIWSSRVSAELAGPGLYAYAGRFEATLASNPLSFARADVIEFPGPSA